MKPEDAIKLRQSAMKLIGYNFGSIGAMVNDKKPYNKDEAIRNAARVDRRQRLHEGTSELDDDTLDDHARRTTAPRSR